jgi:hypothetical protein
MILQPLERRWWQGRVTLLEKLQFFWKLITWGIWRLFNPLWKRLFRVRQRL